MSGPPAQNTMPHQLSDRPRRTRAPQRRGLWLLLCAASILGVSGMSRAESDHDRARQALEAGEVLPLGTVLERVGRDHPGQVLDVELELDKHGGVARWVYELKLLRKDGALVKLEVDARTGTVISRKRKD
ncbi:MAG: PepSY domain-containing protein [Rhodoferax sp.]|nr:PepSY domain-containing protein [Rhodoferax sp.]